MLTFDNANSEPDDPLKALLKRDLPDVIECGETNDYWVQVRRSTKQIELVSKQSGEVVAKVAVEDASTQYGLSVRQIGAAKAALAL